MLLYIHNTVQRLSKLLLVVVFIMAILTASAVTAGAAEEAIAVSGPYSLKIEYMDEQTPIAGAVFRVYRVADAPVNGGPFQLVGDFADCPVTLGHDMTNSEWVDRTEVLAAAVDEKQIPALAEGPTGADGLLSFSGLTEGLYMITGDSVDTGSCTYIPQAFCVYVPYALNGGSAVAPLKVVTPKFEVLLPATPTPSPTATPTATPAPPAASSGMPKTGDTAHPVLWAAILLAASGALIGVAVRTIGKRKKNKN